MLKLPWWKQIWFWLLIAMLAFPLTHTPYDTLNSTIFVGTFLCLLTSVVWFCMTIYDRRAIKTEKARLKEIEDDKRILEAVERAKQEKIQELINIFKSLTDNLDYSYTHIDELKSFQVYYTTNRLDYVREGNPVDFYNSNPTNRSSDHRNWFVKLVLTTKNYQNDAECEASYYGIGHNPRFGLQAWRSTSDSVCDVRNNSVSIANCKPEKVLRFIEKYMTVKEAQDEEILEAALPVIEKSKSACPSPAMAALRETIENRGKTEININDINFK